MQQLAQGGDWVAFEHRPSMVAPPDVCGAANNEGNVVLRADGDTTEIRAIDTNWTLPVHVQGSIQITIGTYALR